MIERCLVIVLDSVGCGDAPDAARYGDSDANTLSHMAEAAGGLDLPNLRRLGLGNLTEIKGVEPLEQTDGAWGRMREASAGKDTETGHWEMAGLLTTEPFRTFTDTGFPPEILDPFIERTGRGILGNVAASGTDIIEELGEEHMRTGKLIVYTSGDSVFQIAAHEEVVPVEELYRCCETARAILNPFKVGRVIARPFVGEGRGRFKRTYNRKDFGIPPPSPTVLNHIADAGMPVVGVGKIEDIFSGSGITESIHTEGNADGLKETLAAWRGLDRGMVMVNLVDFDMLYGHRRDPLGEAAAMKEFDEWLPKLRSTVDAGRDLVMLTADHGNDPTYKGTDHTRECVPILAFGPERAAGVKLGTRATFADLGATVAEALAIDRPPHGESFLGEIA